MRSTIKSDQTVSNFLNCHPSKQLIFRDYIYYMFVFTGCGHCKRMKPDYASAATALKQQGVSIT